MCACMYREHSDDIDLKQIAGEGDFRRNELKM